MVDETRIESVNLPFPGYIFERDENSPNVIDMGPQANIPTERFTVQALADMWDEIICQQNPGYLPEGSLRATTEEFQKAKEEWFGSETRYFRITFDDPFASDSYSVTKLYGELPSEVAKDNKPIAVIECDGSVKLSSGISPDDVAVGFWTALSKFHPSKLIREKEEMVQAIRESVDLCGCEGKCPRCELLAANLPKEEGGADDADRVQL